MHRSFALLGWLVLSCSSDPTSAGSGGDDGSDNEAGAPSAGCDAVTNVSDGPIADETIAAGASVLICYYAQPSEGYCRKITDAAEIAAYQAGSDKGAIGCAAAVILAGPECPMLNAVGKCANNTIDAERVYYECSKFPDAEAHCGDISGSYTAL